MCRINCENTISKSISDIGSFLYNVEKIIEFAIQENDYEVAANVLENLRQTMESYGKLETEIQKIMEGRNLVEERVKLYKKTAHRYFLKYKAHEELPDKRIKGKGVVYTVIIGNYDVLNEPKYRFYTGLHMFY